MATTLAGLGFRLDPNLLLLNQQATKAAIEEVLYKHLPGVVGQNDRVVIFIAGHAETQGTLLPYDANRQRLSSTTLSMGDVIQIGNQLAAKHILFIIDTCYSGFSAVAARPPTGINLGKRTPMARDRVIQILTAGSSGERVAEEDGHGISTAALLRGLRGAADTNRDGVITAYELYTFVYTLVVKKTGGTQHPQFGSLAGNGQFLFPQPVHIAFPPFSTPPADPLLEITITTPRGPTPVYSHNEELSLVVEVSRDAFLYCFYEDGYKRISRVYPNRFQNEGSAYVHAHQSVTIPDGLEVKLKLDVSNTTEAVLCLASSDNLVVWLPPYLQPELKALPVRSLDEITEAIRQHHSPRLAVARLGVYVGGPTNNG